MILIKSLDGNIVISTAFTNCQFGLAFFNILLIVKRTEESEGNSYIEGDGFCFFELVSCGE